MSTLISRKEIVLDGVTYVPKHSAVNHIETVCALNRELVEANAKLANELMAQTIQSQTEKKAEAEKAMHHPTLAELNYGQVFKKIGYNDVYVKVKPSGLLLNSTLIQDHMSRGNCFILNTEYHTLSICKGDTKVRLRVSVRVEI